MDDHTEIDNVAILQAVWGGIQRRHPDVPDVVIDIRVLQVHPDGTVPPAAYFIPAPVPTVVVTDWAVVSPRAEVLKFLLHEAAHALAYVRGVKDGREPYHTKAFGALAAELGLWVDESDVEPFGRAGGYNVTHLDAGTADEYAEELRLLATAEEQVGR
jgi:hypothetical protein